MIVSYDLVFISFIVLRLSFVLARFPYQNDEDEEHHEDQSSEEEYDDFRRYNSFREYPTPRPRRGPPPPYLNLEEKSQSCPNYSPWKGGHEDSEEIEHRNKLIVTKFFQSVFGDLDLNAIDRYIGDPYIQHNPYVADGREAFRAFARQLFQTRQRSIINFWRVSADDDLVWVHTGNVTRHEAQASIDIFRVNKCGKIVEHWDVIQSAQGPFANSHPFN